MSQSFNLNYSLSEKQVLTICSRFLEYFELVEFEPMLKGLSAYMVKVTVNNPDPFQFVIRVINPKSLRSFEHQVGNIIHVKEKNLFPFPNLLYKDNSGEIISESYYCYEYVEGQTLCIGNETLSFEQKRKLYAELGSIIGKMHSEKYPGEKGYGGNFFLENDEIVFEGWKYRKKRYSSTYYSVIESYKYIVKHGFKQNYKQYFPYCKKIWNKYKNYLKYDEPLLGYCHLDLNGDNVIIENEKVKAFIDLEMICFVDRHFDLARCEKKLLGNFVILEKEERKELRKIFLDNYEKYLTIEDSYWDKRPAFFVIELMDDLEWLPDYEKKLTKERTIRIKQNLLEELEELITNYY